MKKTIVIIAVLSLLSLLLGACTGITSINPERLKIDKAYEFTADMQYGEFHSTAQFNRINPDEWEVALTEPFALEGVTMSYRNGETTAQFEGLSGVLGTGGIAELIITSFENAIGGEGREVISSKEQITITSKAGTPAKSYELTLEKRSLEPLTLKIPEVSLTVEFSGVQVSQIVPVLLPGEGHEEHPVIIPQD
jgi:hypothetical protein